MKSDMEARMTTENVLYDLYVEELSLDRLELKGPCAEQQIDRSCV